MSTQTVVDVVVSGSTTTIVDKRIDGITTVAGAPPVTNVSGKIPDLGVDTCILASFGDILSLTNDVNNLRANLIVTGTTLTDEIGVLSGHLISTGNSLNLSLSTLSGNLIATGSNLDSLRDILSGNLISTGQTLTTDINNLSGNLSNRIVSTGEFINTVSGNLITTGQTLTTNIDNVSTNLISTGEVVDEISGNLITTGRSLEADIAAISGMTTGGAGVDILSGNLIATGQTLTNEINTVSGLTNTNASNLISTGKAIDTVSGNLITTGQTLQSQITSNDSDIASLTSNLTTTGQTLTTNINAISNNLIVTGKIIDDISGKLIITGQTLQSQINNNDTDISNLTLNLITTGQVLTSDVTTVSGLVSGSNNANTRVNQLSGDLIQTGEFYRKEVLILSGVDNQIISDLGATGQNLEYDVTALSGDLIESGRVLGLDISSLESATGLLHTATGENRSNLISTGNFLTTEIAIVSGIAGGSDVVEISGRVDTLSGDLITTGQTLTTSINTVSSNLITTGQTLTSEIAIVSGLTTGSSSDPTLSGRVDTLSGNLITTGQTLQAQITSNDGDISTLTSNLVTTGQTLTTNVNTVSSNLISTGAVVDDISGNLITTGQTLQTQITSNDGNITTLTSNLVTTGQTLTTNINTVATNLGTSGQTLQTQITSNDSDISTLTSNLGTTGQTLQTQLTSNDSDIASLTTNLGTTGQTLQTQITSNDSDISTLDSTTVKLTTNQSVAGNKIFTDTVTINNLTVTGTEVIVDVENLAVKDNIIEINSGESGAGISRISGGITIDRGSATNANILYNDANDRFELNFPLAVEGALVASAANLISTGAVVDDISGNLITTGQTLQAQVTSNDGDITALTTNLISTGKTLTDEIAIVSGIATGGSAAQFNELSGNVITTGQTLTTNINTVSSNLISTGSRVDDISGNLITTGQTLQTQITSNDSDITNLTSNLITTGQTLTTDVNTVSGLITDNDADITALKSATGVLKTSTDNNTTNLITTGSVIDDVSGNLITTGQTLQTQITSNDSDISNITSNLVTTGQTLQTQITSNDSDISTLTSNLITTGQTLTSEIAIVSGIATGGSEQDFTELSGALITTGQTLTTNINTVSTNLGTSGQTLQTQITTLEGQTGDYLTEESVSGTYSTQFNVSVANDGGGNKYYLSDVTGPSYTATTQVKQLEVYLNRGETYKFTTDSSTSNHPFFFATQGNGGSYTHEYTSGITNSRSQNGGILYFRVPQSAPDTLYYNCGFHAGMGAEAKIYDNTGILASSSNLISTGAALQTQITSNDADITTLTSNLVTTGQTLTTNINTVSTNLISTGKVVDDISGNLITTGQTLQTQITSNDTDITNLSSNLVTTGQTLTTNINTVATNLVTTGQTLTSEIATVSGLIPATVIDGGGTANTVPLWSDANTIGDSVISQSSSKIGIGTASPSSLLHVYGADPVLTIQDSESTVANASAIFRIGESDGSANLNNNFNIKFVGTASGGDLDISRYNSTTLANQGIRIKHDGNVGIGTITPTSLLHVFSASSSQTYSTGADELIVEGSDHAGISILAPAAKRAQLYFNTDAFFRWVDNDGVFTIDTSSSSSKIAIAPGGAKVGIGTNAPATDLEVYKSSGAVQIYANSNSIIARLAVTGAGLGAVGTSSNADFVIQRNGTTKITVASALITFADELTSQKVAPSANNTYSSGGANYRWTNVYSVLGNFSGAITAAGGTLSELLSLTTNSSGYALKIFENSGGEYFQLGVNQYGGLEIYNETTKCAEWYDTGDFKIPDNIKILLGTGDDLQIYHDGSNNYINSIIGNGDLILDTAQNFYIKHSGETMLQCVNDGAVNLFYNGSKKFETTNTGATVSGGLTVNDSDGRSTVTLIGAKTANGNFADIYGSNNSDAGRAQISFRRDDNDDAAAILFYTEATGSSMAEAVRINSAGCVGIGTAAPADTLHVYGAGTTAIFQSSSANGYISIKETSGGNHVYLGNQSGEFVIQTPGSSYSTKFQVTSVGLVGIGISPTTRLQVKDSVDNSYESGISIVRSADGATTWLNVRGGATNFNNKNNAGNAGLPYRWYQNGTERLKIESSGAVTFNTAFTFPTADGSAGQVLQTNGSGTVTWATVSGGGGVSGSGTDHYIPRWNGTTALQDSSVIALDSGSVGIGTATPTGRLTIKSSGNSSYALEVQSSLDADKIFGVYQDGDGDGALYVFNKDATSTVGLSSVGNSWLTGGNFGIGTNSPSADLHIGSAFSDATNDLSSPALAIKQTGLGVEQGIYLERGGERKGYYIGMAGLDGLAFQRNFAGTKSVVMTLDRTGNVGIGTDSTAYRLEVKGSVTGDWLSRIYNTATTSNPSGLLVRIDDADSTGMILGVNNNGTYHMVVKGDGNVGIGTNAPAAKLEVQGLEVKIGAASPTSAAHYLRIKYDNSEGIVDSNRGKLKLQSNEDIVYTLDSLGIGTATPPHKLSIFGTGAGAATIQIEGEGGADPYINFLVNNTTHWALGADDSASDSFKISQHSALGTNDRITITSGGNFGINVASPGYKLDVEESSANEIARIQGANSGSITFRNAASNVFRIYAGASDSLGFAAGNSFNADHLTINASGTITFNNAFTFPTSDGSAGQVLQTNGSGTVTWATVSGGGGVSGSGTDNYIPRWNGTTALQNSSIYADDNGKVAIGTATPDANHNLTIVNTTNYGIRFTGTNATIQSNANLINVAANNIYLRPATGYEVVVDSGKGLSVVNTTSDAAGIFESRENGGVAVVKLRAKDLSAPSSALPADQGAALQFQGWDGSSFETMATIFAATEGTAANGDIPSSLRFMTTPDGAAAATEKMRIKADGNVGIGTNAPDTKLHIEGVTKTSATVESTSNHAELIIKSENNTYSPYVVFKDAGADRYFIQANTSDSLLFRPQGTGTVSNWVVFSSNGSVGIGTDAPDGKLHVTNTTYIDVATNTGTASALIWRRLDKTIVGRIVADTTNLKTQIWDNNSAVVTIGSDQVGIGTDAPTRLLTLENNTGTVVNQSQLRINNAGAGDSYIYMYAGADWSFGIDNSDADKFKFNISNDVSDGTEVLTLQRDGNVGIGTVAPAAHLHVSKASGTTTVLTEVAVNSTVGYEIKKTGSTTQHWKIVDGQTANGYLEIYDATDSATRMAFNTAGNVGIGTVNAGQLLTIKGDENGTAGKYFGAYASDGSLSVLLGTDTNGDGQLLLADVNGTTKILFEAEANAPNYINNGGAVGIGTATPNAAGASTNNSIVSLKGKAAAYGGILELINYGTSGNGQSLGLVRFLDNTNENAQIEVTRHSATDDANMQFKTRSAGGSLTTRLLINASGTVTFNSAFTFPTTDGSAGQVLQTNGSGTVTWSTVSGGGGVSGSGNANYIPKFTGSSAIGNSTIYTDGQDVAIGSTAFGVGGTIDLSVGSPGSTAGGITLWNTTTGTHSIGFGDANSGTARYEGYLEYSHADNSMRFGTVHAERMRVTSDGNVGIGTNAPLDKLDVYGTGAIFRNLSDDADSVQIVRGTNHTASPDAKFYIYDNSSADWAAKINLDGASYGLDITGGVNYFLLCRDASGNRMFEVHNTSVVVNDGSTDMDFRVEGNGDDYLLFTDGGNDRVAISTTLRPLNSTLKAILKSVLVIMVTGWATKM